MLEKETFVPIQFFKKEIYTGSMKGMRYRVKKGDEGLEAFVYPEPYCYEATPEEQKIKAVFPFSEEGREQAVDWINRQYEEKQTIWGASARK
ncbi:GNAT family acetyltransferase [Clostridium sp. Marseille-P2415]|uniref:GNAT family acetyltransferase n=1 Tax=Clostridium sp. Marseille-P2415 TaxID=1805471 RepID=UPI00098865D6|nr:GNAT family acetyltransferase [Clostridium sp. Marseille-P2415]